jgi:hypothetical protein
MQMIGTYCARSGEWTMRLRGGRIEVMRRFEVTLNTVVPGSPGAGLSLRQVVSAADHCAATRELIDLLVTDGMVGIWCVRQRGFFGRGRRWSGHIDRTGGDGLAGVREPRRPLPPEDAGHAELDLPAA